MKRLVSLILILLSILFPVLTLSAPVYAGVDLFQTCSTPTGAQTSVCKDVNTQKSAQTNPVISLLKRVLNLLALVAGVAAVLLIIINGFRLVVSNGDSNSINSARTGLIYALIGVAVVATAQTIVVFVLDKV